MDYFEEILSEIDDMDGDDYDIDMEHIGIIKAVGLSFIEKGINISQPIHAQAWEYLVDRTLITPHNENFKALIGGVYMDLIEGSLESGFIPSVSDVADSVDEQNMIIITDFYQKGDYSSSDIDIILGNYIQEFSCMMEDWVETAIQNLGFPYTGSSLFHYHETKKNYAPQNILIQEFLR